MRLLEELQVSVLKEEHSFLVGLVSAVILEAHKLDAAPVVVLLNSMALVRCPGV